MELFGDVFLIAALAVTAVVSAALLYRYRADLGIGAPGAVCLALAHTALGVICVKVFAGLESFSDPRSAGMSLFGALFFLPVFYALGAKSSRRNLKLVFDDLSLCVMTALMCVRVNCIISGCCLGCMIAETGMRWPTREVEIAFWAILLIVSVLKKERGYCKGSLYPFMLMVYGVFRFVIEFLREGTPIFGPFHIAHIWAIVSFLIGSAIYFILIEQEGMKHRR